MITQERCHELLEYRDGMLYWKCDRGGSAKAGTIAGKALDRKGYRLISIDCRRYKQHRVIFLMHHGYMPDEVDHFDNNKQNNRIDNLRDGGSGKNQHNVGIRKDNSSGVKGVSFCRTAMRWRARIALNGKVIYLGYFTDLEEAKKVVVEAREKYHGEFANHG